MGHWDFRPPLTLRSFPMFRVPSTSSIVIVHVTDVTEGPLSQDKILFVGCFKYLEL